MNAKTETYRLLSLLRFVLTYQQELLYLGKITKFAKDLNAKELEQTLLCFLDWLLCRLARLAKTAKGSCCQGAVSTAAELIQRALSEKTLAEDECTAAIRVIKKAVDSVPSHNADRWMAEAAWLAALATVTNEGAVVGAVRVTGTAKRGIRYKTMAAKLLELLREAAEQKPAKSAAPKGGGDVK